MSELDLLIFEYSEADTLLVVRDLKRGGFAVSHRTVQTVPALTEALAERQWDLVLFDHYLPDLDPLDALAAVRKVDPETPFIVVTGTIDEQRLVSLMKNGVHEVITKQYLGRLAPVVRRELTEAAARRKHRRLEAELSASEQKYRDLVEGSVQGILIHIDHKPVFVNQAWAEIHGYTAEEVMAMESVLPLMSPPDRQRMVAYREARLRGTPTPTRYEYQAVHRSGRLVWCENLARVISWQGAPAIQSTIRDMTQRKRTEKELARRTRDAEFLHRSTIIASRAPTFAMALKGCLELACKTFDWPVGHAYAPSEDGSDVLVPTDIWHLGTADRRMAAFREITRKTTFRPGEDLPGRVWASGKPEWIADVKRDANFPRANGAPDIGVRGGFATPIVIDGEAAAVLEFFHSEVLAKDIELLHLMGALGRQLGQVLKRQRTEDALRRSEQRFKDVIDAASDWIWEMDENLRFSFLSERFRTVTGLSPRAFLGRSRMDVATADEDDRDWQAHLADLKARRPFRDFRYTYMSPSGVEHHFSISGVPVFESDGNFRGYRGTGSDRTAEIRAECALRQSEQQFRGAFETAPYGMSLTALDGQFIQVNQALCEMFGYSEDDLLSMNYRELVHPEDLHKEDDPVSRVLAGDVRSFQMEERCIRKDGEVLWLLLSVAVMRDAKGEPDHFVAQLVDLTERKKTDERLRQAQKLEAMGQLTGGVAHDFNNLLTVILGNARLLERKLGGEEASVKMATAISSAAGRGAELVQRLLAFSRKQQLETEVVDLGELVRGMRTLLGRTLPEDIEIRTIVAEGVHRAMVDPVQLESALLNLAVNARDAMPGGGALTFEVADARAQGMRIPDDVELSAESDYVVITVSDTGCGIPAHELEHVFEPFYTTKEVGKGSGLGLSMVLGFIRQSGGAIHVASVRERGTTFRLYLPVAEAEDDASESADIAEAEDPQGRETILVVEDQADVRELAAVVLRDLGYRVVEAKDGPDALNVLDRQTGIVLIFSDMVMPGGINGQQLAGIARRKRPGIKVLLTTGYSDDILSRRAHARDREHLITKPYERKELSRMVREILDTEMQSIAS